MAMGERVRQVRKSVGLSQEEFGKTIGITKGSMSVIESEKVNVSTPVRQSICREFNVNREWLETGTGEMFMELSLEEQIMKACSGIDQLDPEDIRVRIMKAFAALDPDDWETIAGLINKIKSRQ